MEGWTRDRILQIISSDMERLNAEKAEISKFLVDIVNESKESMGSLFEQIKESSSRPLIPKTPKVVRKKNLKKIETIPEDDLVEIEKLTVKTLRKESEIQNSDEPLDTRRKSKREALKKAGDVIRQQQSITLNSKMRRPSDDSDNTTYSKASTARESQVKRLHSIRSSDEEESNHPKKQIKKEPRSSTRLTRSKQIEDPVLSSNEEEIFEAPTRNKSTMKRKLDSIESRGSKRTLSPRSSEPNSKKANIIDETIDGPSPDDTMEPSMYEDAIGKAVPIMNSTMKPTSLGNQTRVISKTSLNNQTHVVNETRILNQADNNDTLTNNSSSQNQTHTKMMNLTVVLENVKPITENGRISRTRSGKSNELVKEAFTVPVAIPRVTLTKMKSVPESDPLITDDESSPERKLPKEKKMSKKIEKKREIEVKQKRVTRSSLLSDEEVDLTPGRKILGEINREKNQESKSKLKKNMLFSPYSKESVKKKIEAFEQAGLSNPIEVDTGMRLTRTKTRALAAASDTDQSSSSSSITQKLARKSLAKAKQISRAKDAKESEDAKENPSHLKFPTNDKLVQKQQLRTTPNSKIRPPMPSSSSRGGFTTPSNPQSLSNYSKTMTGSRTNIVTNVDTFIQVKGSAQKPTSNDKLLEERKRKQQEEDSKKKREELLKAQTEERKRKREEKEQKNRLAREAKERQEMERRLQLEKDKADKEKKMQHLQEIQRIENEKKRMAYQKRVLEKEEKRKLEEEMRLQRLREQEETERQLAEQKRREQEVEKRRIAEIKAQQAAAEMAKIKVNMMSAQAKKQATAQNKLINSYKIDSEPDSDSDDELRPKHDIPTWAKSSYRLKHLAMQEYVPMQAVMELFNVRKCSPDLSELFQGIDKNRLKRTSSAIWKTPPRFSMMDAIN
ncbi:inner centromere protein A-like isoform X2 [Leptopilina heterotoma]|nr:inner centromere protein A-like isoform X2 [Leptopilina heterotoma]